MDNMTPTPMPTQQGSKVWPMFAVGILVGAAIGAGGYWWYQQLQPKAATPISTTSTTSTTTTSNTTAVIPTVTPSNAVSTTPLSSEPITYTQNDQLFTVTKTTVAVADVLKPSGWAQNAYATYNEKTLTEQFYANLLSKYGPNDTGVRYDFAYKGVTQGTGIWSETVIPNKLGYANASAFQKDFPTGHLADLYAGAASAQSLEFTSSCPAVDDG